MGLITQAQIEQFFGPEAKNQISKGLNLLNSHHIEKVHYDAEFKHLFGTVRASQRSLTYSPSIFIDGKSIGEVSCGCVRGQKHCGHIAALLVYARDEISCTDVSCSWIRPKGSVDESVVTLDSLFPPRKITYDCGVTVCPSAWKTLLERLDKCGDAGAGVRFLLQPEPERVCQGPLIQDVFSIVRSVEYEMAANKLAFLEGKLSLTLEEIASVEEATRGQVTNPVWTAARSGRLTASNFGRVLELKGRRKPTDSLLKSLLQPSYGAAFHATRWGVEHEKVAIQEFTKKLHLDVQPSGFWLHPCGFLGGSPDGLVGDRYLVEVKCPYQYRNDVLEKVLMVDSLQNLYNQRTEELKKDTYIAVYHSENWHLNVNHSYYHQIQACLRFANREKCFLVLWTTKSFVCLEVHIDETWSENISSLQSFYIEHFVPYMRSRRA